MQWPDCRKSFQAAGQVGAPLYTMVVLQAHKADLLKDLSTSGSLDEEVFSELRRGTDLSRRATKQRVSMSTSGLFGDSVNAVVISFREANRQEEGFDKFLRAPGLPATQPQPGLAPKRREAQK